MQATSVTDDIERVLSYAAGRALEFCGATACAVLVRDREGRAHRVSTGAVGDQEEGLLKQGRTSDRPVRRTLRGPNRKVVCLPLRVKSAFTGAFLLVREREFDSKERRSADLLVDFLCTSLENIVLRERLLTDQLTGLCNSEYFKAVVTREIEFARQFGRKLGLVLLDIDGFGAANEKHGREAADAMLVKAAETLGDALRSGPGITAHRVDVWLESHIGRYGGDEFAFLLFDADRNETKALSEALLARIRERPAEHGGKRYPFTASVGIALYPDDAPDAEKLFIKAYHALYTAKVDGRNRVRAYGESDPTLLTRGLDGDALSATPEGRRLSKVLQEIPASGADLEAALRSILRQVREVMRAERGRLVLFDDRDHPAYTAEHGWIRPDAPVGRTRNFSARSARIVLEDGGRSVGVLELEAGGQPFGPAAHALLELFGGRLGPEVSRTRKLTEATRRLSEMEEQLRHGLRELQHRYTFGRIIGRSKPMQELFLLLEKVCAVDYPVILQGETGVGKELVAKAIHFNSRRRDRPFMPVNCAAISETLLESELFGHEKGAFTGADRYKPGVFELAAGGSLFIDEIEEMSPGMQKKLLRVLEEKQVRPVGGKRFVPVEIRVIASTNREVKELLRLERIRDDLYYRLGTFVLTVPPLRDRTEDIPLIAEALVEEIAQEVRTARKSLSPAALKVLMGYPWPGNVRELRNELRKAAVLSDCDRIEPAHLSPHLAHAPGVRKVRGNFAKAIQDFERSMILQALETYDWNITRAAEGLGMARNTLKAKLRSFDIRKP